MIIHSSQVDNKSFIIHICQIACTINSFLVIRINGILNKCLLRNFGIIPISKRHACTYNTYFTLFIRLCDFILFVKDYNTHILASLTNRKWITVLERSVDNIISTYVRNFRRTVKVCVCALRLCLTPYIKLSIRHYFTAEHHIFKLRQFNLRKHSWICHINHNGRYPEYCRNIIITHKFRQLYREHKQCLRNYHHFCTCQKTAVYIKYRIIKIERCLISKYRIFIDIKCLCNPNCIIYNASVRHCNAFRCTCRTWCEHYINRICINYRIKCFFNKLPVRFGLNDFLIYMNTHWLGYVHSL